MDILNTITDLSHEFGIADYVLGGGGNTSCKNSSTLWVKPSGTTLADLEPETFVALSRNQLADLYKINPPAEASAREALVKDRMQNAVLTDAGRRASVEAPLHDSLSARYVVHTHPCLVNGMTCAMEGKAVCRELFPTALWLDYIDPGYTLCMEVRNEIQNYKDQNGREPSLIFLKNHGVFVAADEPDEIRKLYAEVMSMLKASYDNAGVSLELDVGAKPEVDRIKAAESIIRDAIGMDDISIASGGRFKPASGPISPDHIVYAKSYPYIGTPTHKGIDDFKSKHGYIPQVIAFGDAVFGVSEEAKGASLALQLAQDAALVEQLAEAFGGIDYMSEKAREFIENWEVESYRKKQM
ncbi:short chain dehydrogenase [Anaerohalosphaera lusitana]|uniref:Short chain dehydrogenase n=1 Tax=Anaerohalosphaera lusitana TaxID=1936003 RepID=A0A1U9NK25_9BACT|nr:class II aldolase/adducin family protein [Anaerohalosphaera lusitana]AQT68084.1 short chain dehydrogenase [Anaerohalosphaera lusitana]